MRILVEGVEVTGDLALQESANGSGCSQQKQAAQKHDGNLKRGPTHCGGGLDDNNTKAAHGEQAAPDTALQNELLVKAIQHDQLG